MIRFYDKHIKSCKSTHICFTCKKTIQIGEPYHIISDSEGHGAYKNQYKHCEDCYKINPCFLT